MKTFLVGTVAGLAVGAIGAFVVAHSGVQHQVHIYDKPPEYSATAGLKPASAEATKQVFAQKTANPVTAGAPGGTAAAPAAKPAQPAPPPDKAPVAAASPPKPAAQPSAPTPAPTAPPATTTQSAAATPAPTADLVAAGEKAFNKCKACHTAEANGPDRIGPNLHGVFGRKAGTKSGFKFSDALAKAGITWDDATIDKYIADPKGFIPQNRMAFAGITKADERAAIIAYLKKVTK